MKRRGQLSQKFKQEAVQRGGLGDSSRNLSRHLQSCHEVGCKPRKSVSAVQMIEFRAPSLLGQEVSPLK